MCWLQTAVLFTPVVMPMLTYFTLVNVLVLPGDCFLPCLLTLTGSFFSAKYRRLKRILPVAMHIIVSNAPINVIPLPGILGDSVGI